MKRLFLFTLILLTSGICKAQYRSDNNSYAQAAYWAAVVAESNETRMLNNIRFDYNAIRKNPAALSYYNNYVSLNEEYLKKYNTYTWVALGGVGVMCSSLIPLIKSLSYEYDDPRSDTAVEWGLGIMGASLVPMLVGYCGMAIYADKMKINKKELIYYLKANHNGLGVVALF
ncbi:MAG: hypothetical protein J6K78_02265 [Tidjanibacter sp.]|nr:hypothetical protein [Tidjanibacter sp.]